MGGGWLPQDRAERIGLIVSGASHGALILWALLGGIFFTPDPTPPVATAEVSLMSSEEFAALQARAPKAPTESPAQPSVPEAATEPPATPEAETQPEPDPQVEPETQAEPDAAPDVTELSPVETDVTDAPPEETQTPTPDSLSQIPDVTSTKPKPKPAPSVAPVPTEEANPEADTADVTQEQTTEAPSDQPVPEEVTEETAPKETGEVLETEENKDQEVATSAPAKSPLPRKKPEKPAEPEPAAPAETAEAPAEPAVEETPEVQADDAVAEALAAELAGEASDEPAPGTGTADQGPPMTDGDKDAFRVAVKDCWNVGALSTDALHTIVTISMSMSPDGKPANLRLVSSEGGSDASAAQAFEAGRRAILRCAKTGYPLPAEKYEQWKEIEITFDPSKMALR
ncbi:MAG TPA: cell envelope biogenesis protein TolA [Paracoccaceae bacterium]|nr:cell envelope biogenesis protein TolA [Paracoccaceae bacterium]